MCLMCISSIPLDVKDKKCILTRNLTNVRENNV